MGCGFNRIRTFDRISPGGLLRFRDRHVPC